MVKSITYLIVMKLIANNWTTIAAQVHTCFSRNNKFFGGYIFKSRNFCNFNHMTAIDLMDTFGNILTHFDSFQSKDSQIFPDDANNNNSNINKCLASTPSNIKVDLHLNAESITKKVSQLVQLTQQAYDFIASIPNEKRTFENTVAAIALVEGYFSTHSSSLTFPQFISTDKEIRLASVEANKILDDFSIEISMRCDLFMAVKTVSTFPMAAKAIDQRLIDKILQDFYRSGLGLPTQSDRDLLKEYRKRLSTLAIEFSSTIGEDNTFLVFSSSQLDGLSPHQLQAFDRVSKPDNNISEVKEDGNESTYFKVTMKYPDYFAIMKNCKVAETRKIMCDTYGNRCISNGSRLVKALKLRHQAAQLLGHKDHATFQLEQKMAKTPSEVLTFLNKVSDRLGSFLENEKQALLQEKVLELGQSDSLVLEQYDFAYYTRIQQEKIGLDEDAISKHFPLAQALTKMLEIYERVLSVKFREIKNSDCSSYWHPDVQLFQVLENHHSKENQNGLSDNSTIGYFFVDLFPREGKYSHAACFPIQPGFSFSGDESNRQLPVAAMVANFSKPNSDGVSYLKHYELITLFHELGHVMHHICSKTAYARFHGTSVEGDFVEAPSQMLENWCWKEEALAFLSSHPLPPDSLKALLSSKLLNTAFHYRRQIFFALFDMHIHTNTFEDPLNWTYDRLVDHWKKLRYSLTGIQESKFTFEGNTFGHLMGGCTFLFIFLYR